MNINEIKADLQMISIYFSETSAIRKEVVSNGEYKTDLTRRIEPIEEHLYNVYLTLSIDKEDLSVKVEAVGKFKYVCEKDNKDFEASLIKNNTIAIMFPFVRSQVSLLTTQPYMTPIILPAINITKMVD